MVASSPQRSPPVDELQAGHSAVSPGMPVGHRPSPRSDAGIGDGERNGSRSAVQQDLVDGRSPLVAPVRAFSTIIPGGLLTVPMFICVGDGAVVMQAKTAGRLRIFVIPPLTGDLA